jgi:hypothetical protein
VLLSPQKLIDAGLENLLMQQLKKAGYHDVPLDTDSGYRLYVRG